MRIYASTAKLRPAITDPKTKILGSLIIFLIFACRCTSVVKRAFRWRRDVTFEGFPDFSGDASSLSKAGDTL